MTAGKKDDDRSGRQRTCHRQSDVADDVGNTQIQGRTHRNREGSIIECGVLSDFQGTFKVMAATTLIVTAGLFNRMFS